MHIVFVRYKEWTDHCHPMIPETMDEYSKIVEVKSLTDLNEMFANIIDVKVLQDDEEDGNDSIDDQPLKECMVGRDTECNHPKCPVTDEDVKNGRYCTLPIYDWRQ